MSETMSHSKFKQLLFNPGLSYNVDEDGNDPSNLSCQIVEALQGSEGIDGSGVQGVSKLRARTSRSLSDTHKQYEGKKVKRSELIQEEEKADKFYDPSLEKYFLDEASSEEEEECQKSINNKSNKLKQTKNNTQKSNRNKANKIKNKNSRNSNGKSEQQITENVDGFSFDTNGDFSKYADDIEEDDIEEDDIEEDDIEEDDNDEDDNDEDDSDEDQDDEQDEKDSEADNTRMTVNDFDMDDSEEDQENSPSNLKKRVIEKQTFDSNDVDDDDSDAEVNDNDAEVDDSDAEVDDSDAEADDSDAEADDSDAEADDSDAEADDSDAEADDSDAEADDSDAEADDSDAEVNNSDAENDTSDEDTVKAVKTCNMSEQQQKSNSVTNQLDLYDKLYQCRIHMHKIVSSSHNLPQPSNFGAFMKRAGGEESKYGTALADTAVAATGLMNSLLLLQEASFKSRPDTKSILADGKTKEKPASKPTLDDDDEEITSSEDEEESDKEEEKEEEDEDENASSISKKRAREDGVSDLQQIDEQLAKRHCNMRPYRDNVIAFWEERTRLLQAHNKKQQTPGSTFEAFEEGFAVMVKRSLADKDRLLKRTQLRSIMRGNLTTPLGMKEIKHHNEIDEDLDIPIATNLSERHDPEIYDDRDFYSRYLEDLLKMKMKRGTSSLTNAQFLDMKQKLRKENKKVVDTRRSKGRKLKYDVQSSLLQFLPMRGAPEMDDNTIDVICSNIFNKQGSVAALSKR